MIGVEYVPEAIEDARTNSRLNGIDNTTFYAGDMKDVLDEAFVERNGRPDVVILDPPRAGIHEDVARTILGAAPDGSSTSAATRPRRPATWRCSMPTIACSAFSRWICSRTPTTSKTSCCWSGETGRRVIPDKIDKTPTGTVFRKQHGGKPFFPVVARLLPNSGEAGFAETVERYAEASGKTFRPTQNDRPPRRQAKRCNIPEAGSI